MRKHLGFGLVSGTDTAGHAPQVSISINDLTCRGAVDDIGR